MQHVCVAQVPQWTAHHDRILTQGGGKEATPIGGGGCVGGEIDDYHIIWVTPRPSHLLQIPRDFPLAVGQGQASGIPQPLAGTIEVVAAVQGVKQVGCGCPDLGENLCGGG